MSDEKVIVTKSKLDSLATSISNKSGVETPLTIAEMKTAVDSISTGGGGGGSSDPHLAQKSITANGTYNATDDNLDGYSSVTVNVSAPEVTITDGGSVTQELQPGTIYHFTSTALTSLTITLANNSNDAQYHFDFISPATAPTLNLPSSVSMANHFTVEPHSKFEIDICNNLGVFAEWVY